MSKSSMRTPCSRARAAEKPCAAEEGFASPVVNSYQAASSKGCSIMAATAASVMRDTKVPVAVGLKTSRLR